MTFQILRCAFVSLVEPNLVDLWVFQRYHWFVNTLNSRINFYWVMRLNILDYFFAENDVLSHAN